nr:50S ribosomal protein L2P [uncultured archaeon]
MLMGKNLIQQKRGKGSPTFRARTFAAIGDIRTLYRGTAVIEDLERCTFHTAPLAKIRHADDNTSYILAVEGMKVGEPITIGPDAAVRTGNSLALKNIPEGIDICNLEAAPGDGGKFMRASGSTARIVAKTPAGIMVQFANKRQRLFHPECLAMVGIIAGGGRTEKPFLKAGNKWKAMKARNKYYPIVSGISMNALCHPHGGKHSSKKGRPTIAPKNAPPGRKVGAIRPRGMGRGSRKIPKF